MAKDWTRSDAWIATAFGMTSANGPFLLSDMLGTADARTMRSRLTTRWRRRCDGSSALACCSFEGQELRLSAAGKAATAPAEGGLFSQFDGVLKRLRRIPVAEGDWPLDTDRLDAAVHASTRSRRR